MRSVYLDHAATTPLCAEARDAMAEVHAQAWGNPSSMHAAGQRARRAIDAARDQIAGVLGCASGELIFTSGGTESNNLAVRGVVARYSGERGRHVITSSVEHEAVLTTCRDLERRGVIDLTVVDCDPDGAVNAGTVAAAVRDDTVLVSVMYVNNETGIVNDIAAIARAVTACNSRTLVHTDAVQALGRVDVGVDGLGVDLMTLSAHKVYGPKGAGVLWHRRGAALAAQISGGGQERGMRSGTENVAAIVGFGVATSRSEQRRQDEMERQGKLAQRLRDGLAGLTPAVWIARRDLAVANIVTAALAGVPSEVVVTSLDRDGICVSGGSACSSGATQPSHVMAAMGVDKRYLDGPVRMSLGEQTSEDDIDRVIAALAAMQARSTAVAPAGTA